MAKNNAPLSVIDEPEATQLGARVKELIEYAREILTLRGQYGDFYAVTPEGVARYSQEDVQWEGHQRIAEELVTWDELRFYRATIGTVKALREAEDRDRAKAAAEWKRQQYERLKAEFGE